MSPYQHCVPQLILRKYSNYVQPNEAEFSNDKKAFDKAKSRAKKKTGVDTIDFEECFARGHVGRSSCGNTFGVVNLYEEIEAKATEERSAVEAKLSKLEQRSFKIIDIIEAN